MSDTFQAYLYTPTRPLFSPCLSLKKLNLFLSLRYLMTPIYPKVSPTMWIVTSLQGTKLYLYIISKIVSIVVYSRVVFNPQIFLWLFPSLVLKCNFAREKNWNAINLKNCPETNFISCVAVFSDKESKTKKENFPKKKD